MRLLRLATVLVAISAGIVLGGAQEAQDLGPRVKQLAKGVYVHTGKGFDSNSGIIVTDEGVIVIDTGQNPIEARSIADTVKKLTSQPVKIRHQHRTAWRSYDGPFRVSRARWSWPRKGRPSRCAARTRRRRTGSRRWRGTSPEMKAALEGYASSRRISNTATG